MFLGMVTVDNHSLIDTWIEKGGREKMVCKLDKDTLPQI